MPNACLAALKGLVSTPASEIPKGTSGADVDESEDDVILGSSSGHRSLENSIATLAQVSSNCGSLLHIESIISLRVKVVCQPIFNFGYEAGWFVYICVTDTRLCNIVHLPFRSLAIFSNVDLW